MSRSVAVPASCKVYTPAELAEAMVLALGVRSRESWLDPCIGDGVFPRTLRSEGVSAKLITALDLESEPRPGEVLARITWGKDFLAWAQQTRERFVNIIGNPPYVAISQLPDELRSTALAVTEPDGGKMPRTANYWYAFFCASLKLLRRGGNLCFVLPSAWDYADYAASLRDYAANYFRRFQVHRCERPLFDSVLDGCIIVVGHGYQECPQEDLRFSHDSIAALLDGLKPDAGSSPKRRDRIGFLRRTERGTSQQRTLGELLEIRLGGVTGDARYFLLNETKRRELELPIEALRPVLSRACHLVAGRITREIWLRLRDAGERIWLFDPPDRYLDHPAVENYLRLKEDHGGCRRERYKIKSREPWYRTPLPQPVDGFLSGMTRRGPWLCFSGMSELTATNTLYTFRFKEDLDVKHKAAWALVLLESRHDDVTRSLGRRYADGLVKYEPGDLYRIPLRVPAKVTREFEYGCAVEQMLREDCAEIAAW